MMISISKKTILTLYVALSLPSFVTAQFHLGDDEHDEHTYRRSGPSPQTESTSEISDSSIPENNSPYKYLSAAYGDPHFKTWSGETYDFHGVCDLALLKNSHFDGDLGMDIHIRSMKMHQMWSYINSASIRIGDDILEVKGGEQEKRGIWVNGVATTNEKGVSLSSKYPVTIENISAKSKQFTISLGGEEAIVIKTWNRMVRVDFKNPSSKNFGESVGMMGAFSTGSRLARDGITTIDAFNSFGQEWQVRPTEPKLFHDVDDVPQSPASCEIPSSANMRRRLGEVSITLEEAKLTCSVVDPAIFDMCVFDVMVSNDKDFVGAY